MATQPSLRIGNREREALAAELREHFAHGRLTQEEFNQRLDAAFAAKTQDDLGRITRDLPHTRSDGTPWPAAQSGSAGRPATGRASQDRGHDHGGRGRASMAFFVTLIAALASLLIVIDFLPGLRVLPARIGVLFAIFAVVRGFLRRILGVRRGRCRPW